jgi:hypothetical protein
MKLRSTAGCEKPACPVVWEGAGAQSPASDPIENGELPPPAPSLAQIILPPIILASFRTRIGFIEAALTPNAVRRVPGRN